MGGFNFLPEEDRAICTLFPHMQTRDVARILGRPLCSVSQRATKLGVKKSAAFNNSALSGRNRKGCAPNGIRSRFPKGHVPANKGLRRPGWHAGRMRETQFKKGQRPVTYREIGELRLNADGYVDMKICDAPGARAWRAFHLILWEDANGPIPKGHCLRFRDGDRFHIDVENLELLSRADNARRNSIHNLPKPLVHTMQVLGQLKRRIREAHNRQSA